MAFASCNTNPFSFSHRSTPPNSPKQASSSPSAPLSCSAAEEPKRRLSDQSSWEAKDAEGKDYLYRLGQEADNMNIAVGARQGVIDDLFTGQFLGRDSDIVFDYRQKRRRAAPPSIHPRNRYSENHPTSPSSPRSTPPSTPSSSAPAPAVPPSTGPTSTSTRELTRVLLLHDHAVNWWIPDGQLTPTVPNRSNYIHWIEDLLSSEIVSVRQGCGGRVRGFNISAGANCIYPLLGASLLGWSFVGSDVTDVALEWARKNVESNPDLSELIEIRNANVLLRNDDGVPSSAKTVKEEADNVLTDLAKVESLSSDLKEDSG